MNKHIFDLEFFMFKKLALGVALLSVCSLAQATNTYNLGSSRVVGSEQVYTLDPNGTTTLEYVAAEYHLGLSNMIEACSFKGGKACYSNQTDSARYSAQGHHHQLC